MRIKDFNKFIFTEEIPANNAAGSFSDRTELTVTTDVAYLLNPVTSLASEISEFYYTYWGAYAGTVWINSGYPEEVMLHTQNHYRAVSLSILRKQGLTVNVFKSILNIALGYPFTLVSGIVDIDSSDPTYHYISQYPFQNSVQGTTSFVYKIPKTQTLLITDAQVVDFYQPIVSGVNYYDYYTDGTSWFTAYDLGGLVPLNEIQELDYQVNKKRIVGISRKSISGYNYDFTYFGFLMSKVCPKDVILLYKEIS